VSSTPPGLDRDSIDADLVKRIRSGSSDAFDQLFRSYYAQLCSFAHTYVRSPEMAEEVVQDVFAAIWARHHEWAISVSARAYLFGAVRNRAQRRRAETTAERSRWSLLARQQPGSALGAGAAPDQDVERNEVEAHVRRAIEQLPERSRIVAQLRWQQQLTYPEIASVMGISVKGVENQLGRVTKKLRQLLAPLRPEV